MKMINYRLNKWLCCSYKGINFTIINHLYTYMHEKTKNQITNQNKGQVHQTICRGKALTPRYFPSI